MQTRNGFSLLEMLICVSLVLIFDSPPAAKRRIPL